MPVEVTKACPPPLAMEQSAIMLGSAPLVPDSLVLPEKTITRRGGLSLLLQECRRFGTRGIVLHGTALDHNGRLGSLLASCPSGLEVKTVRHKGGEPTLDQVADLAQLAREYQADWIAGIGGGSVMDLAKAAAALVHASLPPVHYHDGAALPDTGAIFVAVPTTAGTGAEATLNAVLTNPLTRTKKSIRAPGMIARLVLLDADLLGACPPAITAASGMDALTQAMEAYTSRNATWLSDTLALQAVRLIAGHLEAVYREPTGPAAEPLLVGSYLGGVALSFARLGVVHGLAHPLGTLYDLPHGVVCAACLAPAIELNRESIGSKYATLSEAVGGDLLDTVKALIDRLDVANPFAGQPVKEKELIIRETLASGSTKANPKPVTRSDVERMLATLFGGTP